MPTYYTDNVYDDAPYGMIHLICIANNSLEAQQKFNKLNWGNIDLKSIHLLKEGEVREFVYIE